MRRILLAAVLAGASTAVLADGVRWRSPYTPTPGLSQLTKLDEEKQAPVEKREMNAWHESGHRWHVPGFRSAEAPRS